MLKEVGNSWRIVIKKLLTLDSGIDRIRMCAKPTVRSVGLDGWEIYVHIKYYLNILDVKI